MRRYETEFKLKVVKSFLDGDRRAKLLARQWSVPEERIRTWARSLMDVRTGSEVPRCTNKKWTVITLKRSRALQLSASHLKPVSGRSSDD